MRKLMRILIFVAITFLTYNASFGVLYLQIYNPEMTKGAIPENRNYLPEHEGISKDIDINDIDFDNDYKIENEIDFDFK